MAIPDPNSQGYNIYPPLMIGLCVASYLDVSDIPGAVRGLGLDVVWGPVEAVDIFGISYSLAYVAQNLVTSECIVVIRGTNMVSLGSWWDEDFAISNLVPFNTFAPHAKGNPMISQGTANGISYLQGLVDGNGQTFFDFLQNNSFSNLYITGHSLGGALAPPVLAMLNDQLNGGAPITNMAWWTFAGPTSGDLSFVSYFDALWSTPFPGRYHNTLDIAPFCWYSESDVENIYQPYGVSWGFPEDDGIEDLFDDASSFSYSQPAADVPLTGTFNDNWGYDYFYTLQAAYQHSSDTYAAMVDSLYGSTVARSVPKPSKSRQRATLSPLQLPEE